MRMMLYQLLTKLSQKLKPAEAKSAKLQQHPGKDDLEFLPAALELVKTPPSPIGRAIVWTLITLFVITIAWACIGHVDEVAVAQGKVIPSGYTKTVQASDNGVVKKINIQDGSKVKAGDVLIELDTTITAADLARMTKERDYAKLEVQRLTAEQTAGPFEPEADPQVNPQDQQNELRLYTSRMADYQSKLAAAQQVVDQAQATLSSAQAVREKLAGQLAIISTKAGRMQQLVDAGAAAEFQYLDYKQQQIGFQQDLAAAISEIAKDDHALQQAMESRNNVVSEHSQDIMTKLVDARRQWQEAEEEVRKAQEKYRLSTITAPISGTVHQLAVHTVGGVVTPAQALLLIVPDNDEMEIEAWVANMDIGFLHEGQDAEIKVETFNFQKYGTLHATLVSISSDAVEDKDKGLVYRALLRTKVDHFTLANGQTVYLTPGMAVSAEIKTRQKRVIEYFMDPFMKYRSEGLRER